MNSNARGVEETQNTSSNMRTSLSLCALCWSFVTITASTSIATRQLGSTKTLILGAKLFRFWSISVDHWIFDPCTSSSKADFGRLHYCGGESR